MANITSKQLHATCGIGQEMELEYQYATFSDNMGQDVKGFAVGMRGFYDINELKAIIADLEVANTVRVQYEAASRVVAIERPNDGYLTYEEFTQEAVLNAGGNEVSVRVSGVVFCVRWTLGNRFFIRKANGCVIEQQEQLHAERFSQLQAFILDHTQQ